MRGTFATPLFCSGAGRIPCTPAKVIWLVDNIVDFSLEKVVVCLESDLRGQGGQNWKSDERVVDLELGAESSSRHVPAHWFPEVGVPRCMASLVRNLLVWQGFLKQGFLKQGEVEVCRWPVARQLTGQPDALIHAPVPPSPCPV